MITWEISPLLGGSCYNLGKVHRAPYFWSFLYVVVLLCLSNVNSA